MEGDSNLINSKMKVLTDDLIWFIVFNATFSNIMATSFSGGRSRSIRREPATMGKQLVNFYNLRLRVECTFIL